MRMDEGEYTEARDLRAAAALLPGSTKVMDTFMHPSGRVESMVRKPFECLLRSLRARMCPRRSPLEGGTVQRPVLTAASCSGMR